MRKTKSGASENKTRTVDIAKKLAVEGRQLKRAKGKPEHDSVDTQNRATGTSASRRGEGHLELKPLSVSESRLSFFSSRGLSIADAQSSWKKNLPYIYLKNASGALLTCKNATKGLSLGSDFATEVLRPGSLLLAVTDQSFLRERHIGSHDEIGTGVLPDVVVNHLLFQHSSRRSDLDVLRVFLLEMKDKIAPHTSDEEFRQNLFSGVSQARQKTAADRGVCRLAATDSHPFLRKLLERWQNPEAMEHEGSGCFRFALTFAAQRFQFAEAKLLLEYGALADPPVLDALAYTTALAELSQEMYAEFSQTMEMVDLLRSST